MDDEAIAKGAWPWPEQWWTDGYASHSFWNDAYTAVMRMDGGKEIWET